MLYSVHLSFLEHWYWSNQSIDWNQGHFAQCTAVAMGRYNYSHSYWHSCTNWTQRQIVRGDNVAFAREVRASLWPEFDYSDKLIGSFYLFIYLYFLNFVLCLFFCVGRAEKAIGSHGKQQRPRIVFRLSDILPNLLLRLQLPNFPRKRTGSRRI
jgi:hypothetical protein